MVGSFAVRRGGGAIAAGPFLASVVPRPLRANGARPFSAAAASNPSSSSRSIFRSTTGSHSSILHHKVSAFSARSTLLANAPFSTPIASRNFSLWPSSSSKLPEGNSFRIAEDVKESAPSAGQHEQNQVSEALQQTQDAATRVSHQAEEAASDAFSSLQSTAHDAGNKISQTLDNVESGVSSTVNEAIGSSMGVQPGEMTALGLNHWSSPVGWVSNLLETVGLYTGLPWWGTIMVTTVILRLCLSPLTISGQKNAIRLGNVQPQMKDIMDDIKLARSSGDKLLEQKSVTDLQTLMQTSRANPFKSMVPLLFQIPTMLAFYLALSRLAASGSFSFAHGGPWWTMDLTSPDPTWILPALSAVATFGVAEIGFLLGTNATADVKQTQLMKWLFRGAIPVIGYFSLSFPSGVLMYWATTNVWTLIQLGVLQIPFVRKWAKFPKRVQHPVNPYAAKPKGIFDQIKERASSQSGPSVTPVMPSPKAVATSRADALKVMLTSNDKAASDKPGATDATAETMTPAQRRTQRILNAKERRRR